MRIDNYIDNPPYIFDKDMLSVMCLNTYEPTELANAYPIFSMGDFHFVFAEDTSTYEAIGVEYYYPTEKDTK